MEGNGRGEEKVRGKEGAGAWREGFGPPKNFGMAPPMCHEVHLESRKLVKMRYQP